MKFSVISKQLLLLFFFVIQSTYSNADDYESYLIIIGGGTAYEDAVKAKSHYSQQKELHKLVDSEVDIILSDTITGLNPGYYIAVLGCCTDRNKGQLIINTVHRYIPGVYMRKIRVGSSDHYMIPVIRADDAPFEAQRFHALPGLNEFFLCDSTDDGTRLGKSLLPRHLNDLYVNTSVVSFTKKLGAMNVRYYLG